MGGSGIHSAKSGMFGSHESKQQAGDQAAQAAAKGNIRRTDLEGNETQKVPQDHSQTKGYKFGCLQGRRFVTDEFFNLVKIRFCTG